VLPSSGIRQTFPPSWRFPPPTERPPPPSGPITCAVPKIGDCLPANPPPLALAVLRHAPRIDCAASSRRRFLSSLNPLPKIPLPPRDDPGF